MTTSELLCAVENLKMSSSETTAYNFLIEEEYDELPFLQSHEGDRLRRLCKEVLQDRLAREPK